MPTGPSRDTVGPGEIFSRGPYGEKIFDFFKWCIPVYFIFLSHGGVPKRAGLGLTYPPHILFLSTGLCTAMSVDHVSSSYLLVLILLLR